jgi:hypothetical protein
MSINPINPIFLVVEPVFVNVLTILKLAPLEILVYSIAPSVLALAVNPV